VVRRAVVLRSGQVRGQGVDVVGSSQGPVSLERGAAA
jgi:hypothetical protein